MAHYRVLKVGPADTVNIGNRSSMECQNFMARYSLQTEISLLGLEGILQRCIAHQINAVNLELVDISHVLKIKMFNLMLLRVTIYSDNRDW